MAAVSGASNATKSNKTYAVRAEVARECGTALRVTVFILFEYVFALRDLKLGFGESMIMPKCTLMDGRISVSSVAS